MSFPRRSVALAAALTVLGAPVALPAGAAGASATTTAAAPLPFTTVPLEFTVRVGPQDDKTCTVVGDLRIPAGVSSAAPAPGAVLATNGFGGSKDSTGPNGNGSYAARFAEEGYVTLSYSGLGFGGSSCNIYIDDPAYDGKAGSQLVSFLGGAKGIATRDGQPFDVAGLVRLDATGSDGTPHPHDPRVGMIGGSYGGQAQFAIAGIDPRVDALAPVYTWNDLAYSLTPNHAGATTPGGVTSSTPGIWKSAWHSLFFGLGAAGPVAYTGNEPSSCGGYVEWVCQWFSEISTVGYASPASAERVRNLSVASYADKIRVPVLLSQGQRDSLFNLNEAAATYRQLRANGTPVRMLWQSWGHTSGDPVPGELDTGTLEPGSADLHSTYQGRIYSDWMARWLKDQPVDLGPTVRYFRDWAYTPPADPTDASAAYDAAAGAYATAGQYPIGRDEQLLLSRGQDLVPAGSAVLPGQATFVTDGAAAPSSSGEAVVGDGLPQQDAPGTFARWTTAPLTAPTDVAGVPVLDVTLDAPQAALSQGTGPAGKLMLFAKLYDVAPDGRRTLVKDLVSAVRVPDVTARTRIDLQGVVHRFPAGHQVQLVLSAGDAAYKGTGVASTVTVRDSAASPNVLTLPVVRVPRGQS